MVSQVADSLRFSHRYTSGVIAWAPEDAPSETEIQSFLGDFERISFAGMNPERISWTAILHRNPGGGVHIHIEDKGTNYSWLNKKIEELETVRIYTEVKGWKITSGIVRKHARSLIDNEAAHNRGGYAKDAKYWYVIFETEYSRFFFHDMRVHYEALLQRSSG